MTSLSFTTVIDHCVIRIKITGLNTIWEIIDEKCIPEEHNLKLTRMNVTGIECCVQK